MAAPQATTTRREVHMNAESAPMTTSGVAHALQCSAAFVRVLEKSGQLRTTRTAGGIRLFDPREVARVAEARKTRKR
jgi:DNA-binding transcriptional MerR regulator